MAKYRKKPVVIEAIQWKGDWNKECINFAKLTKEISFRYENKGPLYIDTPYDGTLYVAIGDYVTWNGECHVYEADIFENVYEKVKE